MTNARASGGAIGVACFPIDKTLAQEVSSELARRVRGNERDLTVNVDLACSFISEEASRLWTLNAWGQTGEVTELVWNDAGVMRAFQVEVTSQVNGSGDDVHARGGSIEGKAATAAFRQARAALAATVRVEPIPPEDPAEVRFRPIGVTSVHSATTITLIDAEGRMSRGRFVGDHGSNHDAPNRAPVFLALEKVHPLVDRLGRVPISADHWDLVYDLWSGLESIDLYEVGMLLRLAEVAQQKRFVPLVLDTLDLIQDDQRRELALRALVGSSGWDPRREPGGRDDVKRAIARFRQACST